MFAGRVERPVPAEEMGAAAEEGAAEEFGQ
jgi:hypothetical protein